MKKLKQPIDSEIPKGRVKLSRAATPSKSKHKHDYAERIIIKRYSRGNVYYNLGYRCTICGKTKEDEFWLQKDENGYLKLDIITEADTKEKYSELAIVETE